MKKVCAIIIAAGFLFSAFPMESAAAQPASRLKLLNRSIAGLQQKLYDEDATGLNAATQEYLDDILAAAAKNDRAGLQLATARYASDVQQLLAVDNATKCSISLAISGTVAAVGLIQEAASGNSTFCIAVNLTNKVADLMSAMTKYNICIIEASPTPSQAELDALNQKLIGIETYDFATNALDVFLCIPAPEVMDYFSLLMNFIGIFPKAEK